MRRAAATWRRSTGIRPMAPCQNGFTDGGAQLTPPASMRIGRRLPQRGRGQRDSERDVGRVPAGGPGGTATAAANTARPVKQASHVARGAYQLPCTSCTSIFGARDEEEHAHAVHGTRKVRFGQRGEARRVRPGGDAQDQQPPRDVRYALARQRSEERCDGAAAAMMKGDDRSTRYWSLWRRRRGRGSLHRSRRGW